jgi:hypothetical protein
MILATVSSAFIVGSLNAVHSSVSSAGNNGLLPSREPKNEELKNVRALYGSILMADFSTQEAGDIQRPVDLLDNQAGPCKTRPK